MECDGPVPNPRRLRGTPPQTGVHRPPRREHAQHRSGRKLAGSHPAGKGGGIRRHRDRRAAFGRRGAGGHARQHAQPHLPACRRHTAVGTGRSRRQDAPRAAVGLHPQSRRHRPPDAHPHARRVSGRVRPQRTLHLHRAETLRPDGTALPRHRRRGRRRTGTRPLRRHLQQPRERRHPPHRHRRRAADGHSLPDYVRTDRGAGRRHRGRQRHPLRRSGLLPSGRTGQGSGADVRIARRQVRAFRPDQPPRHRFRLDRFPGARLPRAGPAARRVRTGRRVRAPRIGRRGRDPPRRGAEHRPETAAARRTLRRPLPGTGSRRQRPHRAGRPNLHARRPRQAHRHAPSAAPRRRTRPAHHGARRRDHPHGDTGEGRSVRTIPPHPARKQEERSIPPNYARGPANRRASFAGTKYYRP